MSSTTEAIDVIIKNQLYNKVKTDLTNATIAPVNELYNYTRIIRTDEIWRDNPLVYSSNFNNVTMIDINSAIPNLQKRAWKLPDTSCPVVPSSFSNIFTPIFKYNNIVVNPSLFPYNFDYYTGVLTFLSNIPVPSDSNLNCTGYKYTGSNLTPFLSSFTVLNGNIGIGSTTPIALLNVNGNIVASSNIIGSNLYGIIQTPSQPILNSIGTAATANIGIGTITRSINLISTQINVTGNIIASSNLSASNIIGNIITPTQPYVTALPNANVFGTLAGNTITVGNASQILNLNGSSILVNGSSISGGTGNVTTNTSSQFGTTSVTDVVVGSTSYQLTLNSTNTFINTSGNLGINSTSPSENVDIGGNVYISGNLNVATNINSDLNGNILTPTQNYITTLGNVSILGNTSGILYLGATTQNLFLYGNKTTITGGNVGIGSTSPQNALDVTGNVYVSGNISSINFNGNLAGNITSDYSIQPNITTLPALTSAGNIITINNNIGIGTVTPSQKLDVIGNINTNSNLIASNINITTGGININNVLFTDNSLNLQNINGIAMNNGNITNVNNLYVNGTIYGTQSGSFTGDVIKPEQIYIRSLPYVNYLSCNINTSLNIGTDNYPINIKGNVVNFSTNTKVGINSTAPSTDIDINGNICVVGNLYRNSSLILDNLNNFSNITQVNTNSVKVLNDINCSGNIIGQIGTVSQYYINELPAITKISTLPTSDIICGNINYNFTNNSKTSIFNNKLCLGTSPINNNNILEVSGNVLAIGNVTVNGNISSTNVSGIINTATQNLITTLPNLTTAGNTAGNITIGDTINTSNIYINNNNSLGNIYFNNNTFGTIINNTLGNVTTIANNSITTLNIGNSSIDVNVTTTNFKINNTNISSVINSSVANSKSIATGSVTGDNTIGNSSYNLYLQGGNIYAPSSFNFNTALGTAPFKVTSTTQVTNLNAATAGNISGSGIVAIANGGTGISSIAVNSIPYATSTNVIGTSTNLIFNGNTLTVTGTASATTFSGSGANLTSLNAGNISSGTLAVARGGTGISSIAVNSIPYATSTNVIGTSTNLIFNGNTLTVTGTASATTFSGSGANLTSLNAGNISSGTLAVARGGTGISSIAVNSIPYATSTNVIGTSTNLTFDGTNFSLGGTGNLSVGGNINCTNDITAYYSSDDRLKIRTDLIDNPIQKINSLTGFKYKFNDLAKSYGLCNDIVQIGLSAQDVQKVVPEAVRIANFDMDFTSNISKSGNNYLAIDYSRLVPLLVEAIKEQNKRIEKLENK